MKKEEIIQNLKMICTQTDIEDLDIEVFSEIIPENEHQIGMFFIIDEKLYFGEISGLLYYIEIGNIDELQMITYRYWKEDRSIEFVFDFGYYLVYREHTEYENCDRISVYDYNKEIWVFKYQPYKSSGETKGSVKKIENAINNIRQERNLKTE